MKDSERTMPRRPFGNSGLEASVLGFGAGHIGGPELGEKEVDALLGGLLDLGVNLIDTARSYGLSEERIGRHLSHRRHEFVLSTKGGYGVDGVADWTGEVISRGIDAALARMKTDHIDIFFLHSCPADTLTHDDILGALDGARAQGKIRVAAYSGENEALDAAIATSAFGAVQCSVNLCDQRSLDGAIPRAAERGVGVLGKRAVANSAWRFAERPTGQYAEVYWDRLKAMELDPGSTEWLELALRFSAFAPGVSCVLVGTRNLDHLRANAAIVEKGLLPESEIRRIRDAFRTKDAGWFGQV